MRNVYKLFVAVMTAAFISGSAMAGEGVQGFSIGVVGVNADFDTRGTESETSTASDREAINGTASADATFPALFVEYTQGTGAGLGVTIGLEYVPGAAEIGAKSRTDTQSDSNEDSDDSGTYTARAEVEDHYTLYIEPSFMLNDMFGLYAAGGVSNLNVLTLESIKFGADSSNYGNSRVWGAMYGYGFKAAHSSGVFAKVDYRKTVYQEIVLKSASGNKNIVAATPESSAVRLAIGYNF